MTSSVPAIYAVVLLSMLPWAQTGLRAFEQGSHFLIDLQDEIDEPVVANRIPVAESNFAKVQRAATGNKPSPDSEFVIDFKSSFGSETPSAFDLSVLESEEMSKDKTISTGFGISDSDSVFRAGN